MSRINYDNNTLFKGSEDNDYIENKGNHVTIQALGGNDYILNRYGSYSSIDGGAGNDTVKNSSRYVTINGGAGNDSIYNDAYDVLIVHNAGDGNDVINGFKTDSTLSIAGGAATTTKTGNDVIVRVGDGNITLKDAANLETVNIVDMHSNMNIKNFVYNKVITGSDNNDIIYNTGWDDYMLTEDEFDALKEALR